MHMLHSSCSKSSAPPLAFASARLVALRRLVAGRAMDFEEELCSICICIYMFLYMRYVVDSDICIFLKLLFKIQCLPTWHLLRRASWHCVGCLLDGHWLVAGRARGCCARPSQNWPCSFRQGLPHKAGYTIGGGKAPEHYSAAISACEKGEQ